MIFCSILFIFNYDKLSYLTFRFTSILSLLSSKNLLDSYLNNYGYNIILPY